ncbi:MAG: hypothetical protein A2086_11865 [Spirochaetes bacterium GWD1_27_9]|nr:MAG: hypothetical protein A2Y34_16180 [Spirochaetes bacterium GWC1_27_15]OHD28655.1 MAG: hypothetical protein A2086_11865 [Spirochaetes bacterium GWD1_27_9]
MPTISLFYGILIQMFFEDNERHHEPHIHARYQNYKASISINSGEILAGTMDKSKLKLIQAWIEIHREDLIADWELVSDNQLPLKIKPLD